MKAADPNAKVQSVSTKTRGFILDVRSCFEIHPALAFKVDVAEADGTVRGLDVFGGFLMGGHLYLMGEIGDPFEDVLYGPMIHARFAERFEDWLGLVRDHHTVHGSSSRGRITADNPREGFVGDPDVMDTWATSSVRVGARSASPWQRAPLLPPSAPSPKTATGRPTCIFN